MTTRRQVLSGSAAFAGLALIGCGGRGSNSPAPAVTTPPIPVPGTPWRAQHSTGVSLQAAPGGFTFAFPNAPGSIHYVTKTINKAIGGTMRMRLRIEGSAVYSNDGAPAAVRLFFQRRG